MTVATPQIAVHPPYTLRHRARSWRASGIVAPLLGLTHAVSDGAAGLLLGGVVAAEGVGSAVGLVLLYNALAFATQPFVGAAVDRAKRPKAAVLVGLACGAAAIALRGVDNGLAVVVAGAGSSLFHVGGGALTLAAADGRAARTGIFAAPGVVGLAVGGALAAGGWTGGGPWLVAFALFGAAIAWLPAGGDRAVPKAAGGAAAHALEPHDLAMALLLLAIALRSAAWTAVQFVWAGQHSALLALALAAGIGKVVGGLASDRFGRRNWTLGALTAAAALLAAADQRLALLLPGVALLQSATPAMWLAVADGLPGRPALASGLVFGGAIALGGVTLWLGMPTVLGAAVALAAAGVWWLSGVSPPGGEPLPREP